MLVVLLSEVLAQLWVSAETVPTPLCVRLPALLTADSSPARNAPLVTLLTPASLARKVDPRRDCAFSRSRSALVVELRVRHAMTNRLRSSVTGGGVGGSMLLRLSAFEAMPSGL